MICREQSEQELLEELHRADVICIIYSVDDPHTLKQVTHRWLPYVRQILGDDHRRPVILVGNKTDATDANTLDVRAPSPMLPLFPRPSDTALPLILPTHNPPFSAFLLATPLCCFLYYLSPMVSTHGHDNGYCFIINIKCFTATSGTVCM